jgi:hypothetical protein
MNDDYEGQIEIYLTTGELMGMLSVSRSTIYRWRKKGKVSLEVRIYFGTVEYGLRVFAVGHLLLGEGGTKNILGQALP